MKISIIIPAFNEEKLLPATLASVKAAAETLRRRRWSWEMVVSDNNSTDRTALIAREHGAIVVHEPRNQIARARNRGAEAARGEWLVFLDADTVVSERLFDDLARLLEQGSVIGGGALVRMDQKVPWQWACLAGLWNLISRTCGLAAGSFVFCRADAFREVGGFAPDLFAGEEIELSRRLKHLAKRDRRRFRILTAHPVHTSARKIGLYSSWEKLRTILLALVRLRRFAQDREACFMWYDGRR